MKHFLPKRTICVGKTNNIDNIKERRDRATSPDVRVSLVSTPMVKSSCSLQGFALEPDGFRGRNPALSIFLLA